MLLLILLRLDAERFGAAEYDERSRDGRAAVAAPPAGLVRHRVRPAWSAAGVIHPTAATDLFLSLGDRIGGDLRRPGLRRRSASPRRWPSRASATTTSGCPKCGSYPGALLNVVATAFIDEATFRGLFLGFLVVIGIDADVANIIQALVYALTTRLGGAGARPRTCSCWSSSSASAAAG